MTHQDNTPPKLKKAVQVTERMIIKVLIALMTLLLVIATIELGYVLFNSVIQRGEDQFLINLENLMTVFGVFLLVVIGIELLDTIKVYFRKHVIHVEVVMLVAIIAVSRKIIVLDYDKYSGLEMLGVAGIILALAGGYFLIKKTGGCDFWPKEKGEYEDVVIKEKFSNDTDEIVEREKIVKKRKEENLIPPSGSSDKRGTDTYKGMKNSPYSQKKKSE